MKQILAALIVDVLGSSVLLHVSEVQGATFAVVYSFQGGYDGALPSYALTNVNGVLYGTTQYGGGGSCEDETYVGCGTVFSLDPATVSETVVYSFQNYGEDGSNPNAPLTTQHGNLYGTTILGANEHCCGTLFRIDIPTGAEKTLYDILDSGDGCYPTGALTSVHTKLYGTTSNCGVSSGGTMFSFTPKTGNESVIYDFCSEPPSCGDGGAPNGDLIHDGKTFFWGTAVEGGGNNAGAIFAIDTKTGKESVIHTFCDEQNCHDGAYPNGGLTWLNGLWYGTAESGGSVDYGTVFSINLSTGVFNVVHAFGGGTEDGALPQTGLLRVGDRLYGTTSFGGGTGCSGIGCGTVFSIDPRTGRESVLHTLCSLSGCQDGSGPGGTLIKVDGTLYGTTAYGGTGSCNLNYGGCGTVYFIKP